MSWIRESFDIISKHPNVVSNRNELRELFRVYKSDRRVRFMADAEGWRATKKRRLPFKEPVVIAQGMWSDIGITLTDMYFGMPNDVGPVTVRKRSEGEGLITKPMDARRRASEESEALGS